MEDCIVCTVQFEQYSLIGVDMYDILYKPNILNMVGPCVLFF